MEWTQLTVDPATKQRLRVQELWQVILGANSHEEESVWEGMLILL